MDKTVRIGFYAIIGQKFRDSGFTDGKPSIRTAKTTPRLEPHEVPVFIHLELPEGLFKRPRLTASITVPEEQAPVVITPQVQSDIADIIAQQLGVTVNITTNPPAEDTQA